MKFDWRSLTGGLLVGLVAGALLGRWLNQGRSQGVIAQVNGHALRRGDLEAELALFERRAFELLCMTEMVRQEAARLGFAPPVDTSDGSGFEGLDRQVTASLDQIALHSVSEEYLRRFYSAFSEELCRYDLDLCYCPSLSSEATFRNVLEDSKNFRIASAHAGVEPERLDRKLLRGVTLKEVSRLLGVPAQEALLGLRAGQVSSRIPFRDGSIFLRVDRLRDSYADLHEEIRALVAVSRRRCVLNGLASQASIVSDLPSLQRYRQPAPFESIPVQPPSRLPSPAIPVASASPPSP